MALAYASGSGFAVCIPAKTYKPVSFRDDIGYNVTLKNGLTALFLQRAAFTTANISQRF
jgi:hypothetical protein